MDKIKVRYKDLDRAFIWSLLVSVFLFAISLGLNSISSTYATARASAPVGDIILDNIPIFDLDWFFVYGPIFFWVIIGFFLLRDPKKIPFALKSIALFVVIRSVFITLTHLGVSPAVIPPDAASNFLTRLSYGGGLFFSGHTGLPFLMALVFWCDEFLRIFCIASAVFFGTIVLAIHMHYSIDVLAAFFITYTIYHLVEIFFKQDRQNFYG